MAGTRDFVEIPVPDLCRACAISRATFCLHFDRRDELFADLMLELTLFESSLTPSLADCPDFASGVRAIVDRYIDLRLANASLFQTLTFLRRTNRVINESWLDCARILHRGVTKELSRYGEFRALDQAQAHFALEFLAGGMDGVISRVNTKLPRSPFVPEQLDDLKSAVAVLFHRRLVGRDSQADAPPPDAAGHRRILAWTRGLPGPLTPLCSRLNSPRNRCLTATKHLARLSPVKAWPGMQPWTIRPVCLQPRSKGVDPLRHGRIQLRGAIQHDPVPDASPQLHLRPWMGKP